MSMSQSSPPELKQIAENGFAVAIPCLDLPAICELSSVLDTSHAGERNLLDVPVVRRLARSSAVRQLIEPVLGSNCFAVRGIFFNKADGANWKVAWHQDCVIAVAMRSEISGWGPWSIKAGVHHVLPTSALMSRVLAIRIHLDECGADNGPLRVIPGSHGRGFLSDKQIQEWPKDAAVTCRASRGDAILMRPLLLHSSPQAKVPSRRSSTSSGV